MAEGFQHLHPRRLYSRLVACDSFEERAQMTIDFLCGCTAAPRGLLFLAHTGGALTRMSSGAAAPAQDLLDEAERSWHRDMEQPDANRTRTIDVAARRKPDSLQPDHMWMSAEGGMYMRYVLGTYRGSRWVPIGVVLLETSDTFAPLRHAYIESVCNAFINTGNAPGNTAEAPSG
jgi:hypothetical protein